MEPIIRVEHLTHTYSAGTPFQRSAVENVSIDVMPGEFLGIIGHTGSGKSTLIQHLNGLLRPTQGRVLLDGKDIWAEPKKIRQVRFQVGLVFQYPEHQLFENDVISDVCFGPMNQGLSREEAEKEAKQALTQVGVKESNFKKSPFELSGGQKQRISLARALAIRPSVLILDDTTSAVDMETEKQIQQSLRELDFPCTKIVIAQRISTTKTADKIIVLQNGYIEEMGTHEELMEKKGYYYELVKLQTGVDEL